MDYQNNQNPYAQQPGQAQNDQLPGYAPPSQPYQYIPPTGYSAYPSQQPGVQAPPTENNDTAPLLQENNPESEWGAKFTDRDIRMNFVRKVYGILGIQLLITAAFVTVPLYSYDVRYFMRRNIGLIIAAAVGEIVTSIALICCRGLARKVPINYILLTIFTVCEAYLVGFIASNYRPDIVLAAAFSTAGITAGISVYAWTTKKDFTICGPAMLVIGFALCMSSLFILIFGLSTGEYRVAHMMICTLAVIIFSFYLLFDTQLIMGGKRYEVEIDDYILGAIILYTDIITIFLYLLKIFGGK